MNMVAQTLTVGTKELMAALGLSRPGLIARGTREGWKYVDGNGGRQWIVETLPADVQSLLGNAAAADADVAPAVFEYPAYKAASAKNQERTQDRAMFLGMLLTSKMNVQEFCAAWNKGIISKPHLARIGPVSWQTAYRWQKESKDSLDALVPKYRSTKGKSRTLDAHMQSLLIGWYCHRNRRSIQYCHDLLQHQYPGRPISYDSVKRFIESLPAPFVNWARLGTHKAEAVYQPYIDGNPDLYLPMQKVLSDHHCMDFLVERDGVVFRPWLTAFLDYRTAQIVGWCPAVYPSSLTIAVAYYKMILDHGGAELIHIDNGKDYRSQVINGVTKTMKVMGENGIEEEQLVKIHGIFSLCGSVVTFAKAYHGASKGRIERLFGSLEERIGKSFDTYVGSNTVARHEDTQLYFRAIFGQAKRPVLYTWDDYVQVMASAIEWWNHNWRGEGKGMNGRTPAEVFEQHKGPRRDIDPEILSLAFSTAEVRTVGKAGIRMDGVQYYSPELFEYQGRQVVARRQIHKPDEIIVCDESGKVLCNAQANYFLETGDLNADNRKVEGIKKVNTRKVLAFMNQARTPEKGRTMVDIALEAYPAKPLPAPEHYEPQPMPMAAGAEHQTPEPPKARPKLINPFETGMEE